jgi:hypothetical protein
MPALMPANADAHKTSVTAMAAQVFGSRLQSVTQQQSLRSSGRAE